MRIRFQYRKENRCRFLSHLDTVRVFVRAMRRGQLPLAYSKGFNPQARLVFAAPLPVGTVGLKEYGDVFLTERISLEEFGKIMRGQLPPGLQVEAAREVPEGEGSLMAAVNFQKYSIELPRVEREQGERAVKEFLEASRFPIQRKTKKGVVEKDVKPYVQEIRGRDSEGGRGWTLSLSLETGPLGSLRPGEFLNALGFGDDAQIVRQGVFIKEEDRLLTPFGEVVC